jgi:ParB-like chromosome segregation protein Spo0J
MKHEDVPIEKIHIGPRYRKEQGDLESLAGSIFDIGLLQPIGVDQYYNLIFGLRRLRACRDILQWKKIPCAVLEIESLIAGEYAENEFRKDFTPSERTAIGQAMEDEEFANRHGGDRRSSAAMATLDQSERGRSVDLVAKRVGFSSGDQYQRAKTVIEHGTRELIEAMDHEGVSIRTAATIATQPESEQNRILTMPKNERKEAVKNIRQNKAAQEAAQKYDRDVRVYSDLYDSVKFLARFYEDVNEAWAGIARVNGFDFDDLVHKAIQCLVRLEKANPNDRRLGLAQKV